MSNEIKEFGDFKLVVKKKIFNGPKISTNDLHDKVMIVVDYEVGPSKKVAGTLCTTIQIIFEEKNRVIFTSSMFLREDLEQLDENCFPFRAKMVKINDHLKFVKSTQ